MRFPAGVNAVSFTVTIHDDRLVENDEKFFLDLEIPSAVAARTVIKGCPATVNIVNDDGECHFTALHIYTNEHNRIIGMSTKMSV